MSSSKFVTAVMVSAGLILGACQGKDAKTSGTAAIVVEQAWARTTPAGAKTGAGYMTIKANQADRLLSVASPAAEKAQLHESAMDGMVMTMRPIETVALAKGETLTLAPGGKHLMFVGLKAPLTAGAQVSVVLSFEKAGEQTVNLLVRDAPPAHGDH